MICLYRNNNRFLPLLMTHTRINLKTYPIVQRVNIYFKKNLKRFNYYYTKHYYTKNRSIPKIVKRIVTIFRL